MGVRKNAVNVIHYRNSKVSGYILIMVIYILFLFKPDGLRNTFWCNTFLLHSCNISCITCYIFNLHILPHSVLALLPSSSLFFFLHKPSTNQLFSHPATQNLFYDQIYAFHYPISFCLVFNECSLCHISRFFLLCSTSNY